MMSSRHQAILFIIMSKDRKSYPSETQERFIVRFPDGMRDQIKKSAEANGRSMNAEIVARLQATFSTPDALIISGDPNSIASAESLSELRGLLEEIHKEVSSLHNLKQELSKKNN